METRDSRSHIQVLFGCSELRDPERVPGLQGVSSWASLPSPSQPWVPAQETPCLKHSCSVPPFKSSSQYLSQEREAGSATSPRLPEKASVSTRALCVLV